MGRDKSRDGLGNRLEGFALTNFRPLWQLAQSIPPIERAVNRTLINRAINKTPVRPHPLSLRTDYPSWDSLTDRTFSGRHLPPATKKYTEDLPSIEKVLPLFRRPNGQIRLSKKSTMLFGHFAQWFTDGFLRTFAKPKDPANIHERFRNTSNHEIDLSPLYGRTERIRDALRTRSGGLLKSQTLNGQEFPPYYFEQDPAGALVVREFKDVEEELGLLSIESKLLKENPSQIKHRFAMGVERANNQIGYVMFNVLFLREHNRLCRLLQARHPDWDDERLYQTARMTVIAIVLKIVVEEYINHITPFHFQLRANPSGFYSQKWYRTNWMTLEFNLLYRWHAMVPDTMQYADRSIPLEATLFNNDLLIQRGLALSMEDASRQPAGEIGLFNTPNYLIEEAERPSIELSRAARLRSYNDYREYAGFPRVTDFDQITGDPERQTQLEQVYRHVDNIEYFVGLFAEDIRPRSALPSLIGRLVATDAFSQAFTNPLLSERVFNRETFAEGWDEIAKTRYIGDVLARNTPGEPQNLTISMTQK